MSHAHTARAFTLMEMAAVVVIAALIAATVIPAAGRVSEARRAAAVFEVKRLAEYARAHAAASGTPAGVRFDAPDDTVILVGWSASEGVRPLPDALGQPASLIPLHADFGADLDRVTLPVPAMGPATTDTATLWFDHRGTPHLRTTSGVFVGDLDEDATISIAEVGTVTVRARSGLVEAP